MVMHPPHDELKITNEALEREKTSDTAHAGSFYGLPRTYARIPENRLGGIRNVPDVRRSMGVWAYFDQFLLSVDQNR